MTIEKGTVVKCVRSNLPSFEDLNLYSVGTEYTVLAVDSDGMILMTDSGIESPMGVVLNGFFWEFEVVA